MITHTDILCAKGIFQHFPALVEACSMIGGPPVRNRGTIGGNLANASPAADTALPLLTYDASVLLESMGHQRVIPFAEFFKSPGHTALQPQELITSIHVPIPSKNANVKFIKLGLRKAMAIAVCSVAVRLDMNEGSKVFRARIALGSVAPVPMRAKTAESLLEDEYLGKEIIAEVAYVASQACSPISDLRASAQYRREMVKVLVKRALNQIWIDMKNSIADD